MDKEFQRKFIKNATFLRLFIRNNTLAHHMLTEYDGIWYMMVPENHRSIFSSVLRLYSLEPHHIYNQIQFLFTLLWYSALYLECGVGPKMVMVAAHCGMKMFYVSICCSFGQRLYTFDSLFVNFTNAIKQTRYIFLNLIYSC